MIADSVGLKADFFSDTLTAMRHDAQHDEWIRRRVDFPDETLIRDRQAIISIASGLLKILYPDLNVTQDEFNCFCLQPAVDNETVHKRSTLDFGRGVSPN